MKRRPVDDPALYQRGQRDACAKEQDHGKRQPQWLAVLYIALHPGFRRDPGPVCDDISAIDRRRAYDSDCRVVAAGQQQRHKAGPDQHAEREQRVEPRHAALPGFLLPLR